MSATGITPAGFVVEPAPDIKARLDASFKGVYGASIGSNPDGSIPASTSIGQEVAILTDSESAAGETLGAIYAGFDPDQAVTPQLQILAALTGTLQKAASDSVAKVTCFGVIGTALPPGRVVTVTGLGTRFDSQGTPTLVAIAVNWAVATNFAQDALVNANGKIWQCTTPGQSSGAGAGPAGGAQFSTFSDGPTVNWLQVCATGLGAAVVIFAAEQSGPLAATVGQLQTIATPVAGWQGAFNAYNAVLGAVLESDAALRARRVAELQAQGGGPGPSIRAAILALPTAAFPILGVIQDCIVFVNDTDVVANGVPAHGVEVLILDSVNSGAEDQILANAVWAAVGAGTATTGNKSATVKSTGVKDAAGNDPVVFFSRPLTVPIFIAATVDFDPTIWTAAGGPAVVLAAKSALMTFASGWQIGEAIRSSPLAAAIEDGFFFVDSSGTPTVALAGSGRMTGITDVRNGAGADGTLPFIDTLANPLTSTSLTIDKRAIATLNPANITITAVALAP